MQWDIRGYSAIPQEGTVGCSYFVSNVLLHANLKLNRYRLAQAFSFDIAKSLQLNDSLIVLRNVKSNKMTEYVKQNCKEGLYTIGLNCHVGFLLLQKGEVFFIHSSYTSPVKIVIEYAQKAEAIRGSNIYDINNSKKKKQQRNKKKTD